MCRKLIFLVSCVVLLCAVTNVQAAVLEITPDAPEPGDLDIASLVGSASDANNVGTGENPPYTNDATTYIAHDRGGQGQTFITGDFEAGYFITGVWVRHVVYTTEIDQTWYSMQPGSQLQIRITDPAASDTEAFVLSSEIYEITGEEENALPADTTNDQTGTGLWIHVTLDAPIILAANTEYGFDLTSISGLGPVMFFETMGIRDDVEGGNPYTDGSAYVSGAGGVADNVLTPAPGDRVFVVELKAAPAGPKILWVSDAHDLLNPGGPPDDQGWVDLLKSQPEDYFVEYPKVSPGTGPWQGDLSVELIQELNRADLVIVGRDASSGGHNQPDIWNKIGTPVILLSNYIARSSRWQWVDSASIDARQEYYDLQAVDTEHPIFDGVELDPNGQVVWLDPEAGSRVAGFLVDANTAGNGNLIASRPDNGNMLIAEWDTGVNFYEGTEQAPLAKRMLFCAGNQEDDNNLHYGAYNLSAEGEKIFLNAVRYMMTNKPSDPSVEGLVAHYELENDAVDSSGNGLDGILMGEPNFAEGMLGMALDADGVDDYIDCSNDVAFDITDQITVSAWLNIRSIPTAWTAAVAKGENAWRLGNVNEEPRFHFGITIWNAPDTASVDGETAVALDEWHHVIGRFDGRNINVYVDGALDATNPTTVPIGTAATNMFIGDNPEAPGRYWDGLIDDVMIFNRAVTPGEIRYLIGDRLTEDPDADGLVAYYEMENNANDSSGNGLDGRVYDGTGTLYVKGNYVAGPEGKGMAINFNGVNDRVCIGNDSALNLPGSFSASLWAKVGGRSQFMGNTMIGNKALNSGGWSLHQYGRGDKLSFTTIDASSDMDGAKYRMPSASALPLNEWHQIIAIFDSENGEKCIYLDGVLDAAGKIAAGATVKPSGYKTYIGARSNSGGNGGDRYFKGALDDIRIHNKALSLAEVLYLVGIEEFNVFDY